MFTNKMRCSIILGGKGKDRVWLIKSLIYARVRKGTLGVHYKRSKVDQKCKLLTHFGLLAKFCSVLL